MLSPLGITKMPEDFDFMKEIAKRGKSRRRPPKCLISLSRNIYRKRYSPFGVMRKSGSGCASCLLRGFVKRRFRSIPV